MEKTYCAKISEVKRYSDNQIFKTGDSIIVRFRNRFLTRTNDFDAEATIRSFNVAYDGELIVDLCDIHNNGFFPVHLDEIHHIKPIVLIGEYGDSFYKDDVVFKVDENFNIEAYGVKIVNPENCRYFKNSDDAHQYIAAHKPCFTMADIEQVLNKVYVKSSPTRKGIIEYFTKIKDAKTNV